MNKREWFITGRKAKIPMKLRPLELLNRARKSDSMLSVAFGSGKPTQSIGAAFRVIQYEDEAKRAGFYYDAEGVLKQGVKIHVS